MSDATETLESVSPSFVPVCAIGASAGGVTALQGLFRQLPSNLGLAYVVILHLSPDQPSALSDILAGCTKMPVLQVLDGPTLKPDCVYVIPPDRELVIEGDHVTARPFSEPRGRRAPIDMFFRSIAAGRGDGVALVLSGAGADGTLGIQAVKEAGGVIMVQEPAEASFPSMPQNAIASGVADFVAPLARLAERLAEVSHSKEAVRSLDMDGSANDLRRIVAFLRARTGHDFSSYKRATVMRRVMRRMQVVRTDTVAAYADYLSTTPEEAKELFSDLLISVTMFFRDPRAFEALERQAITPIFDDLDPEKEESLRAWVVGCASGEEAYSLAMLLHEEADRRKIRVQFQIFASDLDEGALAMGREGRYPRSIEADVSDERLARFFIDEGTHYRVRKELRESVLFATHSVLKEPPFMRLDLITCRNLLIYMERALQQQICSIFHYGLKQGRFLFLGSAETADSATDLFAPLDRDARIYGARPQAAHALPILPQFSAPERFNGPDQSFLARTERGDLPVSMHVSALERTAPASVLVDGAHNIVHLSPSAGRFILHSGGPVSSQLPAIVRPELRLDLRLALTRAVDGKKRTLTHPIVVVLDGERRRISMHVTPVPNGAHMGAQALVLFLDDDNVVKDEIADEISDSRPDEVRRLHAELKAAQEAVVASRAGHEASIQDLRATNEELQSINEEYRSTAEELETSKEELQSINEELHTVNAELKSKLSSISIAHSDLQNLTDATEIGTLFLDGNLRIKMFTPPTADLFNITKADYGRTITDFSHRLDYDGIDGDARQVLRQLAPIEREVRSREGRSLVMRMRPYRTIEDRIDGVVLTFFDITDRLRAETALRESEALRRIALAGGGMGTWRWDLQRRIVWGDPKFLALWGFPPSDEPHPLSLFMERMSLEGARDMEAIVRKASEAAEEFDGPLEIVSGPTAGRWIRWRGKANDAASIVYGISFDITEQRRADRTLRESEARLATALDGMQRLHALHAGLVGEAELRVAMEAMVRVACDLLDTDRGCIQLVSDDGERLEMFAFRGYGPGSPFIAHCMHEGSKPACDAAPRDRTRLIIENVATFQELAGTEDREVALAEGICATQSTPIISRNGELQGVLSNQFPAPHRPNEEQLRLIDLLVWTAAEFIARHRADAALRESEGKYRTLFENMTEGYAIGELLRDASGQAIDWRYIEFNPALQRHTGMDRVASTGHWFSELFPGADQAYWLEIFQSVVETQTVRTFEEYWAPLDRWLGGVASPAGDGRYYVMLQDVSERKRSELALRASEERFRQFANASAAALWIRDADTLSMEFTSRAIETIYGIAPDALLGEERKWAALIVPDDRELALDHIQQARRGEVVAHDFRIQRPSDGAFRWIRNTDFPLYDSHGGIERIGGIAEDVTEAKLAAEHQGILLAELQHRVRNIMAMMRSITARTGERAESVPDYAALMMGRLLAFARVQALLTRAANLSVGIASLVHEEVSVQAEHAGQYVLKGPDVELSPKAAEVLTLAVHELATNAVKYGALSVPHGKVTVRWSTLEKQGAPWLMFDWTEEGAPARPQPAPGTQPRRGFGSELIEARVPYELKGSGSISIEPGGARCHLEFPLLPGASILETSGPPQVAHFGGALDMTEEADLSSRRILVVEDDYYLANDAARALQDAGAKVLGPCASEEDARRELAGMRPDAVVLDINLGAGASFKLAEHLKDNGIPFVFVTGYDQQVIPEEFKDITRLEKPFQLRQIVGAVSRLASSVA